MATYTLTPQQYEQLMGDSQKESSPYYLAPAEGGKISYVIYDRDSDAKRAKATIARQNNGETSIASIKPDNMFEPTAYTLNTDDSVLKNKLKLSFGLEPEQPGRTYSTPSSSPNRVSSKEYQIMDKMELRQVEQKMESLGLHRVQDQSKPYLSYFVRGQTKGEQLARGYLASTSPGTWAAATVSAGKIDASGNPSQIKLITTDSEMQKAMTGFETKSQATYVLRPDDFNRLKKYLFDDYSTKVTERDEKTDLAIKLEFRNLKDENCGAKVEYTYNPFVNPSASRAGGKPVEPVSVTITSPNRDVVSAMERLGVNKVSSTSEMETAQKRKPGG